MAYPHAVNQAIEVLRGKGIEVGAPVFLSDRTDVGMKVLNFTLTGTQLVEIMRQGRLSEEGIREYAAEKSAGI